MAKRIISILVLMMLICGCETSLNETQSGALAGSALGAGLGAIIGNQSGHPGVGTAIGAGAGALAGGLVGEGIRRQKTTTTQTVPQTTATYVQPTAQVQQIHTKFCPTCGKTYPESSRYCADDGSELQYIQ